MPKEYIIKQYTLALEAYYLGVIDESIIDLIKNKISLSEEKRYQDWIEDDDSSPFFSKSPTFDKLDLDKIFNEVKEKVNPEEVKKLSNWAKIGRIREMAKNFGGSLWGGADIYGKDYFTASKLYEKALGLGDDDSICNLVDCYSMCALSGDIKDFEKYFQLALKYKQKAEEENLGAEIPYAKMLSYLGECFEKGENVQELFDTVFALCVKECGETAWFLEKYYFYGIGVKEDFKKAFKCFEKQDHRDIFKPKDVIWFNDWWWCKSRLAKNPDDYALLGYAKYLEYGGSVEEAIYWYNRVKDSKFEDVKKDALSALAVIEKGGERDKKEIMGNDGYKYLPNIAAYWENIKFDIDEVWAEYDEPNNPREKKKEFIDEQKIVESKELFSKGKEKEQSGDIKGAIKLYIKASNLGSKQASIRLCDFYATANNVEPSAKRAELYYNRSGVDYNDEWAYFGNNFISCCEVLRRGEEPSAENIKDLGKGRYYVYLYFIDEQNKDVEEALYWLNKSAEIGYSEALTQFAEYYEKGEYVQKDLDKSNFYLEQSADEDSVEAQYKLAKHYKEKGDIDKAFFYCKKAVVMFAPEAPNKSSYETRGDVLPSRILLAELYESANDLDNAAKWFAIIYLTYSRFEKEQGDYAQEKLSKLKELGVNLEKALIEGEKEALEEYNEHIYSSWWRLAKCYENGVFLDKNDEKRVEYFIKLANEGEHCGYDSWIKGAQYELARYYKSIKDIEKTIFWAEKCIDGCWEKDILSKARFLLANLYAVNGEIEKAVPLLVKIFKENNDEEERKKIKAELSNIKEKHNVKLEEYFEKELDDQNRQFCYEVGKMYYMGKLLEQNTENALKWLKISAEEPDGNDFAKYGIAEIYEKLGEKEKAIEAYKHFIKKNEKLDLDNLCPHAEKAILRLTEGGNEDDFSIFNFKREPFCANGEMPF